MRSMRQTKVLIGKGHTPMNDAATMQIFQEIFEAAGNLIRNSFRYTNGILFSSSMSEDSGG